MAINLIDHILNGSADTTRGPSRSIWYDCPVLEILARPETGMYLFDDFSDLPLAPTLTTQAGFGRYKAYAASGSSVSRVSTINSVETQGGALKLATDTDNEAAAIAQAYPGYMLTGLSSNSSKLWFECCIAQKAVGTNMASTFIGLGETDLMTLADGVPLNGGNSPTADGAMIGFRIEEDGLGVIDTVYADRATSFTNIGDAEGGTLSAYTFKKLGMVYDPNKLGTNDAVTFYADGVALTSRLSRTALAALTHLDANALGLLAVTVADSGGTAHELYMKWWRIAQLFPGQPS